MRKTILQLTCILLLTTAPTLLAQSAGGTLSGKVTNASGAGIANAAITVTETATNVSQKVLSGADGTFTIAGLTPGTYRMDVETAGYKRTTQQDIQLVTGGPATINVTLEAGSMNETVELKGHAPAVQTSGGEVALGVDTRTLFDLPVVDRNYQQLVELQNGITPPAPAIDMVRDPDRNRFFATNGQSPLNNEWMMDGVVNLEPFRNTAVRVQPVESLQQLDVVTADMPKQDGFIGGGLMSAITPGGTNAFHGDLFEFYSGNILRTRDFFDTSAVPTPRFVYNQPGAALGGAIVPNKTFLFGSYQGTFQNGDSTQLGTVPTAQMLQGDFSSVPGLTVYNPNTGTATGVGRIAFTNGTIPSSMINPTAAAIASYFPTANSAGFYNNYMSNVPFKNNSNKADVRLDQHFTDRTSAFLRYGYTNDWSMQSSLLGNVIGSGAAGRLVGQNAVADVTHEFTPRLVSDLRFGWNNYNQRISSLNDQTALGNTLGMGLTNNLIGINIAGFGALGTPSYVPEHALDNTYNGVWNWGWHTSRNNITWGADIRRYLTDGFTDSLVPTFFGPNGTAYFGPGATLANGSTLGLYSEPYNSLAAFLLGAPSQVGVENYLNQPAYRQWQYGAWLGDNIQLFHRLTLDLGVRYELYSPLSAENPGGFEFYNPTNNTLNYAGMGGIAMHPYTWNTDNVAPRIGLAFRATSKTVIRGGYGIHYFQEPYMLSGLMPATYGAVAGVQGTYAVAPFSGTFGPTLAGTVAAPTSLVNGAPAGNLPATVLPGYLHTPYVQSFNFQVQQEFYYGTVLSLGYVGALDRSLPGFEELNASQPGTGIAGLPFYSSFGRTASTLYETSGLTSNYNALQASLNKRFAQNLSFTASYTWSKALGYTTGNNMILDPYNLRANYGPMDFDRQSVLTISHVWELPFGHHGNSMAQTLLGGWQLNGVFTWATGTPLTATSDPLACACLNTTPFVNLTGPAYLNNGNSVLNPASFYVTPGAFGTLGRGALRGPGLTNYDLSLFKNFHVHDRYNLQLRGEAYNLMNSANFNAPVTNLSSPDFGQQVSTVAGTFGRQVNLGLRLRF